MGRQRRLGAHLAALAFQALEQRGLLAADIGAGADPHLDVEVVFGAGDIGAEQPPSRARLIAISIASTAWGYSERI